MTTDIELEDEVYVYIQEKTEIPQNINGIISSRRPTNSEKEDVVIATIGNVNGQEQKCYLNVNVYVPDIFVKSVGDYVKNKQRLRELCTLFADSLKLIKTSRSRFELKSQRVYEVEGKNEHFINNRLFYRKLNI